MRNAGFPASVVLLFVLLYFLVDLMDDAFLRLHLSPQAASLIVMGIFLGSLVHIPVGRIKAEAITAADPPEILGMKPVLLPEEKLPMTETVIAVNVGGCLIPSGVATYQLYRLSLGDPKYLVLTLSISAFTIMVCYALSRPVPGRGIAMPVFLPPLAAVLPSIALAPEMAPPIAFVAGTLGPLIGADLMNLKAIGRLGTPLASIGGAGTFDGIVLSGLIAALIA
jgi:uncharacterized membrane protein